MHVFILGATGSIGAAVLQDLLSNGHTVVALARSDASEQRLRDQNAGVIRGDLRQPEAWSHVVGDVDAIVHVAGTFSDDEEEVDRGVVDALINAATEAERKLRFIYTGGCWLYGETGDAIASEETPFDPLPAFAWAIDHGGKVLNSVCFDGIIIHPAMVYDRDGGVFSRFISGARDDGQIEVTGSLQTRWPLVHRQDLAAAYRLALEHGTPGQSYNVATEHGVKVADIVTAIAGRFGTSNAPRVISVAETVAAKGAWAAGLALDQQMSGQKIRDELGWRPAKTDALAEIG